MKEWKTIVATTDFSPCAKHAVAVAGRIAQESGAVLHVLHVVEVPAGLSPGALVFMDGAAMAVTLEQAATETAAKLLAEQRDELGSGVEVKIHSVTGEVVPDTIGFCERMGAHLLVVGTHGRRGFSHLLLGSVAERLVRLSPIPVLTVRKPVEPAR